VELGNNVVLAGAHDTPVDGFEQHGVVVVMPLADGAEPRTLVPKMPLHAWAHFGGQLAWLGDGFASGADCDGRYMPETGSAWIFPLASEDR